MVILDPMSARPAPATDPEVAAQLFIQMNDVLVNDYAIVALVNVGGKGAGLVAFDQEISHLRFSPVRPRNRR